MSSSTTRNIFQNVWHWLSVKETRDKEIKLLKKYLQIRTDHPHPVFEECISLLKKEASDLDIPIKIYEYVLGKPIVLLTWPGTMHSALPSVLLNSHMDVAPADESDWWSDPFKAELNEINGNIYGRGIQKAKSTGIQYIEAIRRLKRNSINLKRTIHVSFTPDGELGSEDGMKLFVESDDFKQLNVGFALDVGLPSSRENTYIVINDEKHVRNLKVTCQGDAKHEALPFSNSAASKLQFMLNKFMDYRDMLAERLKANSINNNEKINTFCKQQDSFNSSSVNLTNIQRGLEKSRIPEKIIASFDCRLLPADVTEFENKVEEWRREAGEGVTVRSMQLEDSAIPPTELSENNPYWMILKEILENRDAKIKISYNPVPSDSRFIRKAGIPAINFSAMPNTEFRIHAANEYLNTNVFLDGIKLYEEILKKIGNFH